VKSAIVEISTYIIILFCECTVPDALLVMMGWGGYCGEGAVYEESSGDSN
jgi:hypothetical protein